VELWPAGQVRIRAQRVEDGQARRRVLGHRDGDGAVRLGDRRRLVHAQLGVERCDLPPVRFRGNARAGVAGGDRRVKLVRARSVVAQGRLEQPLALGDPRVVPPGPVLLGQRHQLTAIADPRCPPRVGEQQQREQPGGLRLAW